MREVYQLRLILNRMYRVDKLVQFLNLNSCIFPRSASINFETPVALPTFHRWKKTYARMTVSEFKELK